MGIDSKLPPLILASQSSSRRNLLEAAGVSFMTVSSDVDEYVIKQEHSGSVESLCLKLAQAKAQAVSSLYPYSYVLGTDQVLECNGQIFNKPNSLPIVRSQLSQLSGQRHRLVNGLVMVKGSKVQWSHTAFATLKMRKLSDTFLDDYIKQTDDNLLSSVGGYQLESHGSQLFEYIEGDYFTILGLPLLPLLAYLRQIHILLD